MLNILITGARGQLGSSLRQLGSVSPNNYLATDVAELDITEDVRNEMLIELPINLLCRDDCRGLCPKCGVNLNEVACGCRPEGGAEASPWSALDGLSL